MQTAFFDYICSQMAFKLIGQSRDFVGNPDQTFCELYCQDFFQYVKNNYFIENCVCQLTYFTDDWAEEDRKGKREMGCM